jgi:hypothetical protein
MPAPVCRYTSATRIAPGNENTNGPLRQYFPKGTDLAKHSPSDLDAVAAALNSRPRKALEWKTPADNYKQCDGALRYTNGSERWGRPL